MSFRDYFSRFPKRIWIALFPILCLFSASVVYIAWSQGKDPSIEQVNPVAERWDESAGIKLLPSNRHTPTPQPVGEGAPPPEEEAIASTINCTYGEAYWIQHPDHWLTENIIIANQTYSREKILEILNDAEPTPQTLLLKHLLTSLLNAMQGVDTRVVDDTIERAAYWMGANQAKSFLAAAEEQQAIALANSLQAFNYGELGIAACPDQILARRVSPTPTLTPSPTASIAFQAPVIRRTTPTLAPRKSADDRDEEESQVSSPSPVVDPTSTQPPPPPQEPDGPSAPPSGGQPPSSPPEPTKDPKQNGPPAPADPPDQKEQPEPTKKPKPEKDPKPTKEPKDPKKPDPPGPPPDQNPNPPPDPKPTKEPGDPKDPQDPKPGKPPKDPKPGKPPKK